jgi:hypothetical protein
MSRKIFAPLILVALFVATLGGYYVGSRPVAASSATFTAPATNDGYAAAAHDAFPGAEVNYVVSSRTYRVPAEVPRGDYLITPTGTIFGCTWERRKANDGKPKSTLEMGAPARGSSDEVSIGAADRYLVLNGGCTVTAVSR